MKITRKIAVIGSITLGLAGAAAGTAYAATSAASSTAAYCVAFGHGTSAAGNWVEYNWDGQPCPRGTYPHSIAAGASTDNDASSGGSKTDDDSAYLTTSDASATYETQKAAAGFLTGNFVTDGISTHAPDPTTTFTITDESGSTDHAASKRVWTCSFNPLSQTAVAGATAPASITCTKN